MIRIQNFFSLQHKACYISRDGATHAHTLLTTKHVVDVQQITITLVTAFRVRTCWNMFSP